MPRPAHTTTIGWQQDRRPVISKQEEGDGVRSGPGEAGTILLLHIISARPSKSSRYIWSSVPILFLQEQITDITITWWLCSNTTLQGDKSLQWDLCTCINSSLAWATRQTSCTLPWPSRAPPSKWPLPLATALSPATSRRQLQTGARLEAWLSAHHTERQPARAAKIWNVCFKWQWITLSSL